MEPPNGPFSLGQCKKCKEYDAFKNFEIAHTWPSFKEQREIEFKSEDEAMQAFLQDRLSNIEKLNDNTKSNHMYDLGFKVTVVMAAKKYKNVTKAASEFNVPRRTLRGWIEENDTVDN